jgi:hypothetical protein
VRRYCVAAAEIDCDQICNALPAAQRRRSRLTRLRSAAQARNVIGERVLGFPREYAADRGVPFNQVKQNERAKD